MSDDATYKLLIVEDEVPIQEGLTELFLNQGFEVDVCGDGLVAIERIAESRYDLVLLDIMLPGMTGLEVLARIRGHGDHTPVLLLTARGAEEDIVAGLENGADDYVTKPFGVHELVARVRGLLRRRTSWSEEERPGQRFQCGELSFDLDQLVVVHPAGDLVKLTAREGTLLRFLVEHRHRAVLRDELLVEVWGYRDGSVQTRTVDVHVAQLRAKLKLLPDGGRLLETIRGRGYRFSAEIS